MRIAKGDFVEYAPVDHCPDANGRGDCLPIGSLYRVDAIWRARIHDHCATLFLAKTPYIPPGYGWCACAFKPVYRPKPGVIAALELAAHDYGRT